MGKRISILGGGSMTSAVTAILAGLGHQVMVADKPEFKQPRKNYKPLDLSGFKQPVNGYQAKQRKRKIRRKG